MASQEETDKTKEYHLVLLVIYSVVFLCGTISLSLMLHFIKSSFSSPTSIVILNLVFAHFLFLITVPFRIYYYAGSGWNLGRDWCKMVSSMIHIHMLMSFVLYVIILITRLLTFYHKRAHLVSLQRLHAFIISAGVWIVVFVVVNLVVFYTYGYKLKEKNSTDCFKFGKMLKSPEVLGLNYFMSSVIIVVALVLTALQANVLKALYRKHPQDWMSQQDFRAQLKSFVFALIMVVGFVPYHVFRLYYSEHLEFENINEVLLSLTTFICLDMLTFLGRRTCNACWSRNA